MDQLYASHANKQINSEANNIERNMENMIHEDDHFDTMHVSNEFKVCDCSGHPFQSIYTCISFATAPFCVRSSMDINNFAHATAALS